MNTQPMQYLQQELSWLNQLLQYETQRLRAAYQLSLEEFRGLYVSDDQVDAYLASVSPAGNTHPHPALAGVYEQRAAIRANRHHDNPWQRLANALKLSDIQQDILLLAATIEYDLKYASVLAYLNNDVAQRWPTVDLALRLFTHEPHSTQAMRSLLRPQAPLFTQGVLQMVESTRARPSWRAKGFHLSPVIWDFLIGAPPPANLGPGITVQHDIDRGWEEVFISEHTKTAMTHCLPKEPGDSHAAPVFLLIGRPGAARQSATQALCTSLRRPMITVRADRLNLADPATDELTTTASLTSLLLGAVVFVRASSSHHPDALCQFIDKLRAHAPAVFVATAPDTPPQLRRLADHTVAFPTPHTTVRRAAWQAQLSKMRFNVDPTAVNQLAEQFKLNTGEIARATDGATYLTTPNGAKRRTPEGDTRSLFESTRSALRADFGPMAKWVAPKFGWSDLILPRETHQRLRLIAKSVEHRELVFERWGFSGHRTTGGGLTILFAGQSGTGKTICASVIAQHVGLDLYKIDLSGVVSKYIGETEKNLERIFSTAHASNAVLFFDEADALFGKRAEVKEAHDRFANIEIGYLLQRLEDHDGVVILATNLSNNIDDAFSRRLDFCVEFPMPDEQLRKEMWRMMFPPNAPLGDDVHFDFLAKRFELSGGEIRNVATHAAFRAAQNGRVIRMRQIIEALDEQLIKQGKVRTAAQFGPYYRLTRTTHQDADVLV